MLNFIKNIDKAISESSSLLELLFHLVSLWNETKKIAKEITQESSKEDSVNGHSTRGL